jgi:hypothetical protein
MTEVELLEDVDGRPLGIGDVTVESGTLVITPGTRMVLEWIREGGDRDPDVIRALYREGERRGTRGEEDDDE